MYWLCPLVGRAEPRSVFPPSPLRLWTLLPLLKRNWDLASPTTRYYMQINPRRVTPHFTQDALQDLGTGGVGGSSEEGISVWRRDESPSLCGREEALVARKIEGGRVPRVV